MQRLFPCVPLHNSLQISPQLHFTGLPSLISLTTVPQIQDSRGRGSAPGHVLLRGVSHAWANTSPLLPRSRVGNHDAGLPSAQTFSGLLLALPFLVQLPQEHPSIHSQLGSKRVLSGLSMARKPPASTRHQASFLSGDCGISLSPK